VKPSLLLFPLAHPSITIGGDTFVLLLQLAVNLPTGRAWKEALILGRMIVLEAFCPLKHNPRTLERGVNLECLLVGLPVPFLDNGRES